MGVLKKKNKLLTHCHTINTKANGSRSRHSNKTLVRKDFQRSGDYVLQVAENQTSLYSTFEYLNLHFSSRENAKLGRQTLNRVAFVLLWGGQWSVIIQTTIILLPPFYPRKRKKDKHSLILF